jgi:hypothetical protein
MAIAPAVRERSEELVALSARIDALLGQHQATMKDRIHVLACVAGHTLSCSPPANRQATIDRVFSEAAHKDVLLCEQEAP